MEKSNDLKGFNKDKDLSKNKKDQSAIKEKNGDKQKKSFGQRALVAVNKLYSKLKKIYSKSHKFGIFLFSIFLFIAGPYYIHYLNNRFIQYIKMNGGLRREGSMGSGMRPY